MKLIIDIPDSDYTAVRCEGLYYIGHDKLAESVTTAFQTATPYEDRPQGDLKSGEAIKAYARKVICGDNPTNTLLIRMFDEIIDNAPTVSPQVMVFAENTSNTEYRDNIGSTDILPELPQYHFGRDAFVSTFEQVFTNDEIFNIEDMCQHHKQVGDFLLFYSSEEEFYIIHLPSGTLINWYKHLGRTNTCNKENFSTADLKNLLERLRADIKENNNADNH